MYNYYRKEIRYSCSLPIHVAEMKEKTIQERVCSCTQLTTSESLIMSKTKVIKSRIIIEKAIEVERGS